MNNNDAAQQIPPGYRFFPTEEELISFYLGNKLAGTREEEMEQVIPTVNLYYLDPWQLPAFASVQESEQWFFFCPRQEREAHGGRPARITPSGYWKATGSPGPVYSGASKLIGVKKSMVFYEGKAPRGTKTKWKMNEYRAVDETTVNGGSSKLRSEFSLCRVYKNSGCMRAFDRRPLMDAAKVPEQSCSSEVRNDDGSSFDASLEELREDIKLLEEMGWEDWT